MESEVKNNRKDEITLEDVETAIKILEIFMERYRKAQRVLSKFDKFMSKSSRLEDRIIDMMIQNRALPNIEGYEETEPELTEEEKKRLEELKKKYLST